MIKIAQCAFLRSGTYRRSRPSPSEHVGRRVERPRGSLVAPDGSVASSKCEEQLFPVIESVDTIASRSSGLQPARPTSAWTPHIHPDNHVAICPDPLERLA